uniref:LigA n=1 Tax=Parastrongyloides trichosuri TaxID=131310 RepID=A0A0N4ZVP8_PARTI
MIACSCEDRHDRRFRPCRSRCRFRSDRSGGDCRSPDRPRQPLYAATGQALGAQVRGRLHARERPHRPAHGRVQDAGPGGPAAGPAGRRRRRRHGPAPLSGRGCLLICLSRSREGLHASRHFYRRSDQDLQVRPSGPQACRSGDREGRNLRSSGAERGGQDDDDLHRLRHCHPVQRNHHRRRPRHPVRLPRRPHPHRPGAAGADDRRLRDRLGHRRLQPGPVRQGAEPGPCRTDPSRPFPLGQEGRQDHDPVRRDEAPRHDRQGPEPRTGHPVPRRTHSGRRRRTAPRHVVAGAPPARTRRDHHPDHPLHRGSRGDGRSRRRHPQGRTDPGREDRRPDAEAGQEDPDASASGAAGDPAARTGRMEPGAAMRRGRTGIRLRFQRRAHRPPARARSKTSSSAWSIRIGRSRDELQWLRSLGHLPLRDGAGPAHPVAVAGDAGHHDVALFRRLRRRHRQPHDRGGRRPLRRLHRAGADHAQPVHSVDLQRLLRHLLPQVHRDDLRDPVRARLAAGDRAGLCRGGGDQVGDPGPDHPGNGRLLRAAADIAPLLDAGFPDPDLDHLRPVRLHHRGLGAEFRAAAVHSHADRHAPDLPGRRLLFDRDAARGLAHARPVQPGGLFDLGLPLGLLRRGRRQRSDQPCGHAGLLLRLSGGVARNAVRPARARALPPGPDHLGPPAPGRLPCRPPAARRRPGAPDRHAAAPETGAGQARSRAPAGGPARRLAPGRPCRPPGRRVRRLHGPAPSPRADRPGPATDPAAASAVCAARRPADAAPPAASRAQPDARRVGSGRADCARRPARSASGGRDDRRALGARCAQAPLALAALRRGCGRRRPGSRSGLAVGPLGRGRRRAAARRRDRTRRRGPRRPARNADAPARLGRHRGACRRRAGRARVVAFDASRRGARACALDPCADPAGPVACGSGSRDPASGDDAAPACCRGGAPRRVPAGCAGPGRRPAADPGAPGPDRSQRPDRHPASEAGLRRRD